MNWGISALGIAQAAAAMLACLSPPAKAQTAEAEKPMDGVAAAYVDGPPLAVSVSYSADLNAVAAGGTRRASAYLGKLAFIVDGDLERLLGIRATALHASVIDIHGVGLSSHYLGNLATASGIEAEPAIRLNQLWVETSVGGSARIRAGKFAAAPNFMTSEAASFFVNATFGWPTIAATDLPQGGPAWPLAAPGLMLTIGSPSRVQGSAAIFAGNPSGSASITPQSADGHGFKAFQMKGAPLLMGELAARRGRLELKVGGWHHFGQYSIVRGAQPSLARGNWSFYAVADISLNPTAKMRRFNLFARFGLAPRDRNQVPQYVDAGAVLNAPFAGRERDAAGIGWSRISVAPVIGGRGRPEQVVELSYSAAIGARLTLQPNLQLIIDPANANRRDAIVTGLRVSWQH